MDEVRSRRNKVRSRTDEVRVRTDEARSWMYGTRSRTDDSEVTEEERVVQEAQQAPSSLSSVQ